MAEMKAVKMDLKRVAAKADWWDSQMASEKAEMSVRKKGLQLAASMGK
jgi:hypothetical protein